MYWQTHITGSDFSTQYIHIAGKYKCSLPVYVELMDASLIHILALFSITVSCFGVSEQKVHKGSNINLEYHIYLNARRL